MYQNLRKVQFAYEQNEVMNLSPVQITEHLYKALGKCLRSAREGLLEGNPARKGENIGRAISILGELRASLDLEGGEEEVLPPAEKLVGLLWPPQHTGDYGMDRGEEGVPQLPVRPSQIVVEVPRHHIRVHGILQGEYHLAHIGLFYRMSVVTLVLHVYPELTVEGQVHPVRHLLPRGGMLLTEELQTSTALRRFQDAIALVKALSSTVPRPHLSHTDSSGGTTSDILYASLTGS